MEVVQRKKKTEKEKEKVKTAGVRSNPLGREQDSPIRFAFGDLGLATTRISVRHTVSVRTWIAGEIKPVTKGNSIWTNLEEIDLDNGARNLPAAKTTALFRQSSGSQPQEQISGPSQLHRPILSGSWGRASTTRLRRGNRLICRRLRLDPLSGLSQPYNEVLSGPCRRALSLRRGANRGNSISKWFLHLSSMTPDIENLCSALSGVSRSCEPAFSAVGQYRLGVQGLGRLS